MNPSPTAPVDAPYAPLPLLQPTADAPARGLGNGGVFVTWLFLGIFSLIFAWYSTRISAKAKLIWTGLVAAQLVAIVIIVLVAVRPFTGGVDTSSVQQFLNSNIPTSVEGAADAPSDETVNMQNVTCVQASTNTWTCDASYEVIATAENIDQNYTAQLDVTCDSTGTCTYAPFQQIPSQ